MCDVDGTSSGSCPTMTTCICEIEPSGLPAVVFVSSVLPITVWAESRAVWSWSCGFHSDDYGEYCLLDMTPCSLVQIYFAVFGVRFWTAAWLVYLRSSEASVNVYQSTWRHIPEMRTFQHKEMKLYKFYACNKLNINVILTLYRK
jgi:hypothetical protein